MFSCYLTVVPIVMFKDHSVMDISELSTHSECTREVFVVLLLKNRNRIAFHSSPGRVMPAVGGQPVGVWKSAEEEVLSPLPQQESLGFPGGAQAGGRALPMER